MKLHKLMFLLSLLFLCKAQCDIDLSNYLYDDVGTPSYVKVYLPTVDSSLSECCKKEKSILVDIPDSVANLEFRSHYSGLFFSNCFSRIFMNIPFVAVQKNWTALRPPNSKFETKSGISF
jgi:hypothetical protein